MALTALAPTLIPAHQLPDALMTQGYGVLSPQGVGELIHTALSVLDTFKGDWQDLPADNFLKDGGKYRRRRHSCFVVSNHQVEQVVHRAHYQPVQYNALHGGMHRLFEPMNPQTTEHPAWAKLLSAIASVCTQLKGDQPWYVEAHQFRIDTSHGIGRPTPEGAHRDGVDFVAILLVDRVNVSGGESRIFEANGPHGQRFTLTEPWTMLLLDDHQVIHESTPIQPTAAGGHRDTLVLTFRAGGFLAETTHSQ